MITIGVVLSATATYVTSMPATPAATIAGPPICDIWIAPETRVWAIVEPLRMKATSTRRPFFSNRPAARAISRTTWGPDAAAEPDITRAGAWQKIIPLAKTNMARLERRRSLLPPQHAYQPWFGSIWVGWN